MEKKRGFLRVYLIVALMMGILGLLDSILTLAKLNLAYYGETLALIAFLFFWFNLTTLIFFIYQRLEKITYVLPVYHMAIYILFTIIAVILFIRGLTENLNLSIMVGAGILAAIFEIGFSVHLLMKFSNYASKTQ
ncbi:MAG: hypothetical protein ABIG93_02730 [archaeon]|nr:hypothetical protein [Nanoarchaeota archaeon]